jgi:hypothetical protein
MASPLWAGGDVIRFDLPPTVAANPILADQHDANLVECRFQISALVAAPQTPQIDQWIVICQPRDETLTIADYDPRTDVASDVEGPIQVKTTSEESGSIGISLDTQYGHSVRGNLGADKGRKHADSRQYAITAPARAITAAGTINRGRGVYFKWKQSANQVLEGEKEFRLVLRVPTGWRGSLIDVSVTAQSERRVLAGLDKQIKTLGHAQFVVAAYREGDSEAARASRELAAAEHALREFVQREPATNGTSLSSLLRQVAIKLDLESADDGERWISRLLAGDADPHFDKTISGQPMEVRLAVLDYCELREEFGRLSGSTPQRHRSR